MSAENETIADIVAELRDVATNTKLYGPQPTVYGKPIDIYIAEVATDIAAAHKREVDKLNSVIQATVSRADAEIDRLRREISELEKKIGNAAKLREALITILDKAHEQYVNDFGIDTVWIQNVANTALAAPPRNCDVGTAEEQAERYMNFCHNYPKCTGCPCVGRMLYHQCEFAWAQMPYEAKEGGNNVV